MARAIRRRRVLRFRWFVNAYLETLKIDEWLLAAVQESARTQNESVCQVIEEALIAHPAGNALWQVFSTTMEAEPGRILLSIGAK